MSGRWPGWLFDNLGLKAFALLLAVLLYLHVLTDRTTERVVYFPLEIQSLADTLALAKQPPAEVGDLHLLLLRLGLARLQRGVEARHLVTQRGELAGQDIGAQLRVFGKLDLRLILLLLALQLRPLLRELLFELVAQDRQRLDITAQCVEFAQLDFDLLLVGGNRLEGRSPL